MKAARKLRHKWLAQDFKRVLKSSFNPQPQGWGFLLTDPNGSRVFLAPNESTRATIAGF